jgi:cytochrome c-type biogenesis protein CcmH
MRRQLRPILAALLACAALSAPVAALAVEPDEMLADPALEARAQAVTRQLRCVVCQNQSIDDSAAPLARDMRLMVRERLVAGDTDEQAKAYLVSRYGDFVLLKPPFQPNTWALWLGPVLILLLAAAGLVAAARSGATDDGDDQEGEQDPLANNIEGV